MKIIDKIAAFLLPARCVLCGEMQDSQQRDICLRCETAAKVFFHQPWKLPHVKSWHAMWQYDGVVRESLVRYKFWHRRSYGRTYGRELAKKMREWKISYDVISWVPVSSLRKISRGYDQVAIIADNMGKQLGQKPVRLLKKCRNNRKQSTIQGIENRKKNVEGVYRVANNADVKGKQVLLLDDIITTGATISEAAAVLKKAGAKEVHAVCVAVANKYHK